MCSAASSIPYYDPNSPDDFRPLLIWYAHLLYSSTAFNDWLLRRFTLPIFQGLLKSTPHECFVGSIQRFHETAILMHEIWKFSLPVFGNVSRDILKVESQGSQNKSGVFIEPGLVEHENLIHQGVNRFLLRVAYSSTSRVFSKAYTGNGLFLPSIA